MSDSRTCDTSVLVPALLSWHPAHEECRAAVVEVAVLPSHVFLETYSVLTRLPAPHRVAARDAAAAIEALDLTGLTLPAGESLALVTVLGRGSLGGGAVYDALVAATARHHGHELLTRDRRARATYDLVGVRYAMT